MRLNIISQLSYKLSVLFHSDELRKMFERILSSFFHFLCSSNFHSCQLRRLFFEWKLLVLLCRILAFWKHLRGSDRNHQWLLVLSKRRVHVVPGRILPERTYLRVHFTIRHQLHRILWTDHLSVLQRRIRSELCERLHGRYFRRRCLSMCRLFQLYHLSLLYCRSISCKRRNFLYWNFIGCQQLSILCHSEHLCFV